MTVFTRRETSVLLNFASFDYRSSDCLTTS